MKNLLLLIFNPFLIIIAVLIGCSNTPETITVQGIVTEEDSLTTTGLGTMLTGLSDCNVYMIETDDSRYMAMTPNISLDPLDSAYVGTFVLSKVIATGTSKEYFGGELTTTKSEFRNLISYKPKNDNHE